MISKTKVRFIKSLQVKKYRLAEQCFLVQGAKTVNEVLASDYRVELLCATPSFLQEAKHARKAVEVVETSEKELTAIGSVEANSAALAVVRMKPSSFKGIPTDTFTLVLDDIRDPGNLGTIIRTADWYGIGLIIASPETTDVYSPKVINSTMGSFLRVTVHYAALGDWLRSPGIPVYGAFLDGKDVHATEFGKAGLLVIGNESKGISPAVEKLVTHRVTIPRYGKAESLNASVATAVILDNLRRKS
ncbi:MAG: RNA methyltransferase [Cyclobacteriaceae bacterium]|nr:RNA methyltransferase [Cyclobacteriaceae bacterium]